MGSKMTAATAAAFVLIASAEILRASPIGVWLSKDGAKLRVVVCGDGLCGFVAGTSPVNDPATGRPFTDKHNPDPAKRDRPLIGVQTLSVRPDGAGRWSGSLYNDDDGRTYSGRLIELDPTRIRIEGCVVFVCGGEELTRIE
jgi:uncharacterized protein (DUF2147 family)